MDTIQQNAHVVLEYTLKDGAGELLDASDGDDGEPIVYVHGYGMLVPGLEAGLEGLAKGTSKSIVVEPELGFGDRDEDLVMEVAREEFPDPKKVAEGDEFIAEAPDGEEVAMRVIEVKDDVVIVDANHPLAGVTLHYAVKVTDVREATADEIAEAEEEASELGCDDPSHDHGHHHHHEGCDHDHDHAHGHTHDDAKKLH